MGAPVPEMQAVENESAEALLSSLKSIGAADRRDHATVYNYWLSIRGDRPFPPIRDLDPLEISDAGAFSVLLGMIGGGEDAEIRHLGHAIKGGVAAERISEAPSPSLLSCIHAQLPIVMACKQPLAFEDSFATDDGTRRCWVTLLPFGTAEGWIDYVYGFVSMDGTQTEGDDHRAGAEPEAAGEPETPAAETLEPFEVELKPFDEQPDASEQPPAPRAPEAVEKALAAEPATGEDQPEAEPEAVEDAAEPAAVAAPEPEPAPKAKAGFSAKVLQGLADVGGFYGKAVQATPKLPVETVAEVEAASPAGEPDGSMQAKLAEVRAKAEEAYQAQLRSNLALYQGLSAAYDFALDAEADAEDYLKLVEARGLKIQLRSPMKPVVKLGFDGLCDDATIVQLEAVLAWALKMDLPRGSLAERIEAEGGIEWIVSGKANPA